MIMERYIVHADASHSNQEMPKIRTAKCPLRKPARHVKKSIWAIYWTVMLDVFSHSSWNGW